MSERGEIASLPETTLLVTGATGYVGGRLLRNLREHGHRVRCLARNPERLESRAGDGTEVVRGDAVTGEGLEEAMCGVETAFYLIHSMGSSGGFEEEDRRAAANFGAAARTAGVRRIVYLGGLADESRALSAHLRSRVEVGNVLRSSGVPVVELRASIVIGSGSLSFEMVRAIVEHLPILLTPRWVSMPAQPIAIDDLLAYLMQSLDTDTRQNPIYEIGGAECVSYRELMREYAAQRGLRRAMIPVPLLTPWLSSLWLGLVTPLQARVGRKLIDSIRHDTVVRSDSARRDFQVRPMGVRAAIARALQNEDREFAETRWSDALSSLASRTSFGGTRIGRRVVDSREIRVSASPSATFAPIRQIGGRRGWYGHDWLWQLRGFLDVLVGGVGMRRGRRHPEELRVGDTLDCWRVEALQPDCSLTLAAEMRVPGRAWLSFEVTPDGSGSRVRQTALFEPSGLAGLLYWYGVYPLHSIVFSHMLAGIAKRAQGGSSDERALPDSTNLANASKRAPALLPGGPR